MRREFEKEEKGKHSHTTQIIDLLSHFLNFLLYFFDTGRIGTQTLQIKKKKNIKNIKINNNNNNNNNNNDNNNNGRRKKEG